MTEGLIQKVISKHNRNECECKHACHNLLRIQQELIEEIKKYTSWQEYLVLNDDRVIKIKDLIGDNEY